MARLLAYGSLMWDNALAAYQGERVRVQGMRRAFVGESTQRWGSPERPCPQIGLVMGDGCEGVLFRIPLGDRRLLFHNLKQRERRSARAVSVLDARGRGRKARSYLPSPDERLWPENGVVLEALHSARGVVGTGVEYIRTIIHAMELWGIEDPLIERIWEEVRN
ncbi:MAG: gamma-glutamylcyclotransferase [Gemmatimonadota bacterium]